MKIFTNAASVAAIMAFAAGPVFAQDSTDVIKIPIHNWSSQIVGAHIVGKLLEKGGAKVEYVSSDSQVVYTAMCEGDVSLENEVWEGAFGVAFEKVVKEGCVIDAATHDAKTREEWWYPSYVGEMCPGLPAWEALNACADKFSTAETAPKGRFLGGPVDWLKHDAERVEALGMNFEVVNAGSAAALWAELASAVERKEPIVLFNWTPNFVEALYEGKFVEFPAYDPKCKDDPSWGTNKELTYDCGNPKDGYLKIAAWKEFPNKWPKAYAILQKVNFSNMDVAVQAKLVDIDNMEPEQAADKWLADNQGRWQGWLTGTN
ncbi:ABC transporter substrate-binding protein [Mesorhizobium sp. 1M-11]|uniref:ABC transporter substrate-binding protein n=1 Tax=Mesorhizobium sp. 1M-11 TaxID=1529006 RepID=UPI0006C75B2F|nr:ABC transporter substrate-binding protein [Mesorhizobium sp. 1M-11]